MRNHQQLLLTAVFIIHICSITWADQAVYNYYTSNYGALCHDACDKRGENYYWCHTKKGWDKCSPAENTNYYGNKCRANHPCGKYGEDYYWCKKTGWFGGWERCGLVELKTINNHYTSKYGEVCYDPCAKRDEKYYWCNTKKGWDKCSPAENTDCYGNKCQADRPCGKYGENYYRCKKTGWFGGWERCGLVEPKTILHKSSTYQSVCIDDCVYDTYYKYFWCHTEKGWDYCSPAHDVTYQDEPCQSDHHCDNHNYPYTWCNTESSWNYCGLIKPGECTYFDSRRKKRQDNTRLQVCSRQYTEEDFTFTTVTDTRTITSTSARMRRDISDLIDRWENKYLRGDGARSNLITLGNFRIDNQGMVNRDSQRYYNLQIQINTHRKPRESTTVSQILLPQGIEVPDKVVRKAFTESLALRAKVTVIKINRRQ